jgi:hypothetical protein
VLGAGTGTTVAAASSGSGKDGLNSSKYEIGLFGDMPYGSAGRQQYPAVIADMNEHKLTFSIFDGDIKNGSEPCYADYDGSAQSAGRPDVYQYALDRFAQQVNPVVYLPGDNEWTDCDRASITPRFDSLDRLEHLRQVSYGYDPTTGSSSPYSLGQRTIRLQRQSDVDPQLVDPRGYRYVENVRWTFGPVTYVGLNVPGSDNNWIDTPIDGQEPTKDGDSVEAQAEYAARNAANLQWLRESFAAADRAGSKAVTVVLQADMLGDNPSTGVGTTADPTAHFADTKAELARQAIAFNGQVVLVNGDSHYLTIDKPLTDKKGNTIENVSRVMTFGSGQSHWVSAVVDPSDPNVFQFVQHVVPANEPAYVAP